MVNEDNYTREHVKEAVEIDRDNLDIETSASICRMIQETLHKESLKFIDVIEQLTKTYRNEFVMGDFGVCLAVSDGLHDEPIISLVTGSIPGTLKNLLCLNKGFKETVHDKAAD